MQSQNKGILSFMLTCLKLFLIIMWLVTLEKGAKSKSDRVPSCCALPCQLMGGGLWGLRHSFNELEKLIFPLDVTLS